MSKGNEHEINELCELVKEMSAQEIQSFIFFIQGLSLGKDIRETET